MSGRKSYDVAFKLRAVTCAESNSKEKAAREFKVDPKRIREWCSNKEQLMVMELKKQGKTRSKRLRGAGRKVFFESMEEELFDWVIDLRGRNVRVSRRMIIEKAKDLIAATDPLADFKASKGWLQLFMRRKNLSLRKKTTVCQKTPEDLIPKLISYITHLKRLRLAHKFTPANIFAMDETACWMDMPSNTTIDVCGAKCVPLKTTGHEKDHFTVILSARANGKKCKPYIVFKGKGTRLVKKLSRIQGVVVRFSADGWMNDQLTMDYLHSILGSLSFEKRLLVWDAYKCHTSEATRNETKKMKLHTAVIPGGCTKYIQAPDVVWNSSFKSHLRNSYDVWLSEPALHEFTKGGNIKPPSRSLLCEWIKASWESISEETIRNSFLSCAVTTNTNGNEDHLIHCFKAGQPCESGLNDLMVESMALASQQIDQDPFASEEDDSEEEENEVFLDDSDETDIDDEQ